MRNPFQIQFSSMNVSFTKKKMEFSSTKIIIRAKIMLYKNRDKISVEETNNALFTRQIDIYVCCIYRQLKDILGKQMNRCKSYLKAMYNF